MSKYRCLVTLGLESKEGVDSVKECVSAIREKYEVDYGKEVE